MAPYEAFLWVGLKAFQVLSLNSFAHSINFSSLLQEKIEQEKKTATKTKILPKARKINFSIRFQSIKILTGKSSHQDQDPAKSWKISFFNTFLICFQYFFEAQTECKKTALPPKPIFPQPLSPHTSRALPLTWHHTKPFCGWGSKLFRFSVLNSFADSINFSSLLQEKNEQEKKTATKTKILPKARKINFSIRFQLKS